ncbi:MAG: magnesium/cobalt transporter CorA [Chloroflexota bacterium]|jgi:magnesium transporter
MQHPDALSDQRYWQDLTTPNRADLEALGLNPLVVDDIVHGGQRTKIERYDEGVFFVFYVFSFADTELAELVATPVYIFVTPQKLYTIHHGDIALVRGAYAQWLLRGGEAQLKNGAVLHLVLDTIVDSYFPLMDDIGDYVENVELAVLMGSNANDLRTVLHLKRTLLELRRSVAPAREALNALLRGDLLPLDRATLMNIQDVYDHVLRTVDAIDLHRDMLASILDVHLSVQSNRLNNVMKVLTIASVILMVNALIAGIYGMNFAHMPELEWQYGYPLALGLMGLASIVVLLFFRWKGWLQRDDV